MPVFTFPSPLEALVWAKDHHWDDHAIAVIADGGGRFHVYGFTHHEWITAYHGDWARYAFEHNVVAWEVFDVPEAEKPSFEDITSLLNPSWQRCSGCGGFHPVHSEC